MVRKAAGLFVIWVATGCGTVEHFTDAGGVDASGIDGSGGGAIDTTIDVAPDEFSAQGTAVFEFHASLADATFVCSVDGAAPVDCASPFSRALADGPHTFSVAAIDSGGSQDPSPAEHTWTIDTAPPDTEITAAPPAVDNSTSVDFSFTSDETAATFECRLDGGSFAPCTSPATYGGITRGAHSFAVRASDAAGNVDASPATHAWSVDTSAPDTTIDAGPTGAVASTSASFAFSSPDAGPGATFECSLDGAAFAACASPQALSGLAEAAHLFQVRVRDSGGNTDPTPAMRAWTVDLTAPTTAIVTGPSGAVPSTSATFTFSSNESPVTYQCNLDGGGFASCPATHLISGLGQGAHTLQVRAIDGAGNADASPASRTWTVDTVPPDTSFVSGPTGLTNQTSATFDLGSNETGVSYQCSLDGGAFSACADPHTITVGDGAHTRGARAVDAAGNTDATPATRSWTVDATGPIITITAGPAQNGTSGPYVTFSFTVDDGSAATCRIDGGAAVPCTGSITYSLNANAHAFQVSATDTAGNTTTVTRNWTVACAAQTGGPGGVALFHMEETSGQVLNDSIAPATNGQLGPTGTVEPSDPARLAAARFGRGLRFDFLERDTWLWPSGVQSAHDHTVELWVMTLPDNVGAGGTTLFASQDGRIRVWSDASGTQLQFKYSITNDAGVPVTINAAPVAYSQWRHVVATYSGTTMTLWVNGVAVTGAVTVTGSMSIGNVVWSAAADPLAGDMDEAYFGTTAMTSTQVLNRYCPL